MRWLLVLRGSLDRAVSIAVVFGLLLVGCQAESVVEQEPPRRVDPHSRSQPRSPLAYPARSSAAAPTEHETAGAAASGPLAGTDSGAAQGDRSGATSGGGFTVSEAVGEQGDGAMNGVAAPDELAPAADTTGMGSLENNDSGADYDTAGAPLEAASTGPRQDAPARKPLDTKLPAMPLPVELPEIRGALLPADAAAQAATDMRLLVGHWRQTDSDRGADFLVGGYHSAELTVRLDGTVTAMRTVDESGSLRFTRRMIARITGEGKLRLGEERQGPAVLDKPLVLPIEGDRTVTITPPTMTLPTVLDFHLDKDELRLAGKTYRRVKVEPPGDAPKPR